MSVPEDFRDPGAVILATALGENPLAGSIFEPQDIHSQDKVWQEEHKGVLEREDSRGDVELLDADDLPTFYSGLRLAPIAILLAMAYGIYSPLSTEFLKLRVCLVTFNFSANVCNHISEKDYKAEGDKVVEESAHYQLYMTLVGTLLPIGFSLFVGSWSDMFGRKLPMLVPFVGFFVASAYISVISNFTLSPAYLLPPPIISSLTGGWTILLMAMFSFIGDYTTDKNRAMNIAVIDGLLIMSGNIGAVLGGLLFQHYGFQIPFYVVTCMQAISFIYILVVIRDRIPREKGSSRGCIELFSTSHLRENIRMLRKDRVGDTKTHIYIILACLLLFCVCDNGDGAITQLFVEFQPFGWTVEFYTIFSCIAGLSTSVCIMIFMLVFRKFFGIPDTTIAFIAAISGVLYFSGYGIAKVTWMLYISAGLGILRALVYVCIRSLLSGMVEQNEIGKSMSLISSMQALTPLFGSVIFTTIFAQTSSWFPGLCFQIAAFLMALVMAAFAYIDVVRRREIYSKPDSSETKPLLA